MTLKYVRFATCITSIQIITFAELAFTLTTMALTKIAPSGT